VAANASCEDILANIGRGGFGGGGRGPCGNGG